MKKIILSIVILLIGAQMMQGQVLISLLLGDKLNSDKLKFGLDGGVNFSTISNINPSKYNAGFNLGFYFDILLKENKNWYLHTGVIVRSPMGANNLSPYSLNDPDLDTVFMSGFVDRQLRYFNVPLLVRYEFKQKIFVELGAMLGLLNQANDVFYNEINEKKDISYKNNILGNYKRFDVGIEAGIGYHLLKGTGMNFGLRYYYGVMDILKNNPSKPQRNSSFYLYVSIPIGAGEKAKAKVAVKEKKRLEKKERKERKKKEKNGKQMSLTQPGL